MDYFLEKLLKFNPITIQCHDNPDADTLGSGYGLYMFFKGMGKDVRLIYSGRNTVTKPNLIKFIDHVKIPLEYIELAQAVKLRLKGLLITVDCQYGAGNVTRINAENVAIIDHHQVEIDSIELSTIRSNVGSCSTIIWDMLRKSNFDFKGAPNLETALYYGLYTDTNQLSEIFNPLDRDASEQLHFDRPMISELRNSNISMKELEISGVALIRNSFNEEFGFSVIRTQECDPNILGLIADFLLQVDCVNVCVVFNECYDGYKLSVRSCIKEVNASELAGYLTAGVGSGGGHLEKAGGFISKKLYHETYPGVHGEAYFNNKLVEYFSGYQVYYADSYEADISGMAKYSKKPLPIGYVKMTDVLPAGTPITVRTIECDMDLVIEDDLYMMIGIKGEVYPNKAEKFFKNNRLLNKKYSYEDCVIENLYIPTVKNRIDGKSLVLTDYAYQCEPMGSVKIYARELDKTVKVFTQWDKDRYMLGMPGDYLAVREDDCHDVYIIERKIFEKTYARAEADEGN